MKRILVLGSQGMAGHMIKMYLQSLGNYDVRGLARKVEKSSSDIKLDVSNYDKLIEIFKKNDFDIVINCIGLLNNTAEENPELAIWYNSYFPHLIASLGNKYNFKLIHISTDCVFSGSEGGYEENANKNGIGFYAQSKALGEITDDKNLTLRTSIIGPEIKQDGIGLFHWFMNQERELYGYKNVYWTGVTTLELAKAIRKATDQDLKGLYHLVNNEKINKYDLLQHFNRLFRNNELKIIPEYNYKSDKSLINTRSDFDFKVASYENMLSDLKKWVLQNKNLYNY